jgi:hypothetical protein
MCALFSPLDADPRAMGQCDMVWVPQDLKPKLIKDFNIVIFIHTTSDVLLKNVMNLWQVLWTSIVIAH